MKELTKNEINNVSGGLPGIAIGIGGGYFVCSWAAGIYSVYSGGIKTNPFKGYVYNFFYKATSVAVYPLSAPIQGVKSLFTARSLPPKKPTKPTTWSLNISNPFSGIWNGIVDAFSETFSTK